MSKTINLYPVIGNELLIKIGYQTTNYEFYLNEYDENYSLGIEQIDQNSYDYVKLIDEKYQWDLDKDNLLFKRNISLENPAFLFGKDGVSRKKSELGVGLIWISKDSNQRGAMEIGTFTSDMKRVDFTVNGKFLSGTFSKRIDIQTVIYLKNANEMLDLEEHLSDISGTLLGTLDSNIILIEGDGSEFPIVEVEDKKAALWWIECDWEDIKTDEFNEENLRICLNKSHKNYKELIRSENEMKSPIFLEILSSVINILILKAKESEDWEDIDRGIGLRTGSIGEAIHYFLKTFNLEDISIEKLNRSIRENLEKKIL